MDSKLTARFEAALPAEETLAALVRQFQAEGLAQVEIYDTFLRFRQELGEVDREPEFARMAVILDRIVGWCSPAERLFPVSLTQADLVAFYASRPPAAEASARFDPAELLALYDRHQRREVELPGLAKETLPGDLVRFTAPAGGGLVLYSRLAEESAAAAITAQAAHFGPAGLDWTVFAHDLPAGLGPGLARRGFIPGLQLDLLCLDLGLAPEELLDPPAADLRPITRPDRLEPILRLAAESGTLSGPALARLAAGLPAGLQDSDALSIYLGYANNIPARPAWAHFFPSSPFAEIGGSPAWALHPAGPLADLDAALLQACLQEAARRGLPYAVLQATPAARPRLEALGFRPLTTLRTWQI